MKKNKVRLSHVDSGSNDVDRFTKPAAVASFVEVQDAIGPVPYPVRKQKWSNGA